jgi:hypothetical protein
MSTAENGRLLILINQMGFSQKQTRRLQHALIVHYFLINACYLQLLTDQASNVIKAFL